jgi:hypothetical protein
MFCRHCGTKGRDGDMHCTKCGQPLSEQAEHQPGLASEPYTPRQTTGFRLGRFVTAHTKGLLILAGIAIIAGIGALSDGSSDTTPGAADAAPAAAVTTEETAVDQAAAASQDAQTTTTAAPVRVGVKGADGRTYYCSGAALADAKTKKARSDRRDKVLTQRKRSYRRFLAAHPEKRLAPADYDRYKYLRARYSAQLKFTNSAIDSYNHVLDSRCDPQ